MRFNLLLLIYIPNEYSQEFHYYPFTVKLDKCVGSCNILNDLSDKVCVPNKSDDLNLNLFNMITGINESKTLTKHSDQWWNNDKFRCECKNIMYVKKIMFGILLHVIVKMENI